VAVALVLAGDEQYHEKEETQEGMVHQQAGLPGHVGETDLHAEQDPEDEKTLALDILGLVQRARNGASAWDWGSAAGGRNVKRVLSQR
jgi:hypothetical protein